MKSDSLFHGVIDISCRLAQNPLVFAVSFDLAIVALRLGHHLVWSGYTFYKFQIKKKRKENALVNIKSKRRFPR